MIVGIGVDLVKVDRIRQIYERFGTRFANKILSPREQESLGRRSDKAAYLAKRFAAKEAVAKALGTGMRSGVHFVQISVERNRAGAPQVVLHDVAREKADALGVGTVHLSISDEADAAIAFVVLERAVA